MLKEERNIMNLRSAAEKTMREGNYPDDAVIDSILQELQVHKIELEMQNDELRIANEEIEIQRIKFEGIYDLAPIGYFILNHSGLIEEVNTAGMNLLETGKASIRSKTLNSFVAPDNRDRFYMFYKELLRGHERQRCQLKFIAKGGREFYALLEGQAVTTSSTCYIAMIDVTESIEARLALAETKDRLQLALEASAAGTWELHFPSMRFYLDEMSHCICQTGDSNFAHTYNAFIKRVHPNDRFEIDQHFRTAINTEREIDVVSRFINEAGEIYFVNIRGHLVPAVADKEKRFVGIMSDITEKKKLEEKAEQQKLNRQREIAVVTFKAEEKERKRISESLHDSVSQLLYGIKIQLGQMNEHNMPAATARLNKLLDMAITETRNISFELAPPILADFGLEAAITELCERLSTPKMKISAAISGFGKRGDLMLESTMFRIIQELINNCMKHSEASQVRVNLKKAKRIVISVSDNGSGFILSEMEQKRHGAGLISIRNRLQLYNGILSIDSGAEQGTTVRIELDSSID